MNWHHYERDGYTFDSSEPLTPMQVNARFDEIKAHHALRQADRLRSRDPRWSADDVAERFGGPTSDRNHHK